LNFTLIWNDITEVHTLRDSGSRLLFQGLKGRLARGASCMAEPAVPRFFRIAVIQKVPPTFWGFARFR